MQIVSAMVAVVIISVGYGPYTLQAAQESSANAESQTVDELDAMKREISSRGNSNLKEHCDRIKRSFISKSNSIDWATVQHLQQSLNGNSMTEKAFQSRILEISKERDVDERRFGTLGCVHLEIP